MTVPVGSVAAPTLHIFLDTNVLLGFFKLSGEDLEELRKLVAVVRGGRTRLYVTQHQLDEFSRNRGSAIAESLRAVEQSTLPTFPRIFQNLDGFADIRDALRNVERMRRELLAQCRAAALDRNLQADQVLDAMFSVATTIPLSEALTTAATLRRDLGNPPGKQNSLGDAINWESLLATVPDDQGLNVVTGDKDFASKLAPGAIDEFLYSEWVNRKRGVPVLWPTLTALLRQHYPDITLAAELEKELAIDALIASDSFRATHLAVASLRAYGDFTAEQAEALAAAAIANGQIGRIIDDADVHRFYSELVAQHGDHLMEGTREALREALAGEAEAPDL